LNWACEYIYIYRGKERELKKEEEAQVVRKLGGNGDKFKWGRQ
jgi:hypothetical protein